MGTIIWLIVTLVLAGLELAAGEFTFLMLAGGALAATGASLIGGPVWVDVVTFAIVSVGLIVFLRPLLRRKMRSPLALDTSPQALVGTTVEVLEDTGAHSGQIRLDGSIWSARSLDPAVTFRAGEIASVVRIDATTAIIWKEP
ncbi:membrane protein [Corynebacterium atypicum]|uniref:Membrane protein n=1 Tax=Corynebacterium atypicum TaxID=191610 RepID=A0ABM5QMR8_9CORY|nr:NfeD family protein [Corynebacterium atypicum]AIG64114.1 membrane protein [Corynebacterium atypicum]